MNLPTGLHSVYEITYAPALVTYLRGYIVSGCRGFTAPPAALLRRRLQGEEYERETPYEQGTSQPAVVRIKLKQHAGQAASSAVQEGGKVKKGQLVGRVEDGKLGANVHASIDGKVRAVTAEYVEISA